MDWLMKIGEDEYVEWSTVSDQPISPIVSRTTAVYLWDEDRVAWTDKNLCSCRARMGENIELRNGRVIFTGGGKLAYSFDSFEEVIEFMCNENKPIKTQDELRLVCESMS